MILLVHYLQSPGYRKAYRLMKKPQLLTQLYLADPQFTLTLQKSRMPQVRGVKSEAVVIYCEPLTTKEMGYYRLSRRVNNTVKKPLFLEIPWGCVLIEAYVLHQSLCLSCFTRITPCYLCNYRVCSVLSPVPFASLAPSRFSFCPWRPLCSVLFSWSSIRNIEFCIGLWHPLKNFRKIYQMVMYECGRQNL